MDCIAVSVMDAVCSTVDIFFTDFILLPTETGWTQWSPFQAY